MSTLTPDPIPVPATTVSARDLQSRTRWDFKGNSFEDDNCTDTHGRVSKTCWIICCIFCGLKQDFESVFAELLDPNQNFECESESGSRCSNRLWFWRRKHYWNTFEKFLFSSFHKMKGGKLCIQQFNIFENKKILKGQSYTKKFNSCQKNITLNPEPRSLFIFKN